MVLADNFVFYKKNINPYFDNANETLFVCFVAPISIARG